MSHYLHKSLAHEITTSSYHNGFLMGLQTAAFTHNYAQTIRLFKSSWDLCPAAVSKFKQVAIFLERGLDDIRVS